MTKISWLHLTDFHYGLKEQNCLWPNVREEFYNDLKILHDRAGPWDLVLFTGDLTQKGSNDEFNAFSDKLKDLLNRLSDLGSEPCLLFVPGNHDLARPNPKLPIVKALQNWHQDEEIRDTFWNDTENDYYKIVIEAFEPFNEWAEQWRIQHPIPPNCTLEKGILPGDFSFKLWKDGFSFGIIGLNSSFLQITNRDYEKQLDLNTIQFHSVCGGDGPKWINQNHINLLMTHHPFSWFHKDAQDIFSSEISPSGRFSVHLCGHKHESSIDSIVIGGSDAKNCCQGSSLFGLEFFGKNKKNRIHGYNSAYIKIINSKEELCIYPRILTKLRSGKWKIVPEVVQDLNNDEAIIYESRKTIKKPYSSSQSQIQSTTHPFPNNQKIGEEKMIEELSNVDFPASDGFLKSISEFKATSPKQINEYLDTKINFIEMALQLFIVSTIRCYENIIISEPVSHKKKVKFIQKLITKKFTKPTIGTLLELSRHCFHLISEADEEACEDLLQMKACLNSNIKLGPIAFFFNEIDRILNVIKPQKESKRTTIYNKNTRLNLYNDLLPNFIKYCNKLRKEVKKLSIDNYARIVLDNISFNLWESAFRCLISELIPIISGKYVYKELIETEKYIHKGKKRLSSDSNFLFEVITYQNSKINIEDEILSNPEGYFESYISLRVLLNKKEEICLDLFPFLLIRNGKLYHYKSTKAKGYEYYSIADNSTFVYSTKKRFIYSAFKIGGSGDKQALFWTEVPPNYNEHKTIKANIPTEGLVNFVGRSRQQRIIKNEIIDIPNQNGIVFGPGGVGKTALMLQISSDLFNEQNKESVIFNNIIWVSSKSTYFNTTEGFAEIKNKQFESLDNIFSVILHFFDYEDAEEYDYHDKMELVLDLLEGNKLLLILDNFETIKRTEQNKIIKFFSTKAKSILRQKPDYFKVILTSREQIPSGFHQIKLNGLEKNESKKLMKKLFQPYKESRQDISAKQKDQIHDIAHGIPIVIKHCYGQVFEFNKSLKEVLLVLQDASSKVIQFSYEEVFNLFKKDDTLTRFRDPQNWLFFPK